MKIEGKYDLYVANNKPLLNAFGKYIENYNDKYVGIDFEFNQRKIALMQINFGTSIWIVDPTDFDISLKNLFVKKILMNDKIYKILHGADSLDIPYIFTELLDNNREYIIAFIKRLLDTRFLCEYYCSCIDKDKHCSIYDTLLLFNVINEEKYNFLENVNKSMGPIFTLHWNVRQLKNEQLKYAYYDVVYLKDLLFAILKTAKRNTSEYYDSYQYIPALIRLILLNKKGIIDLNGLKMETDKMNNFMVNNITLVSIFDNFLPDCKFDEFDVKNVIGVSYLKNDFITILKYLFYCHIASKFDIYVNKNDKYENKMNVKILYEYIKNFPKVIKLFGRIDKFIENNLNRYI